MRDQFFRDWLNDHYLDFIREGLRVLIGDAPAIEWTMNPTRPSPEEPGVELSEEEARRLTRDAAAAMDPALLPQLNARYVFDTFVAGRSNEFAFAACKAVADKPALAYNPLSSSAAQA